jgi:hypothetical protein
MAETPFIFELHPRGEGPPLKDRMADARTATAGHVSIVVLAVVAELRPIADDRPARIKVRKGLKALDRCGLQAKPQRHQHAIGQTTADCAVVEADAAALRPRARQPQAASHMNDST